MVIRAGVEPRDPDRRSRCAPSAWDRHPVALGSQHLTDGQTVDGRHHQVEDQQVDGADRIRSSAEAPSAAVVTRCPRGERAVEGVADRAVVVDHQDPRRLSSCHSSTVGRPVPVTSPEGSATVVVRCPDPIASRLRGASVLALPLFVVAVIGLSLALASTLSGRSGPTSRSGRAAAVAAIAVPAAIGVAALVAVRGCFVDVDGLGGARRGGLAHGARVPTETIAGQGPDGACGGCTCWSSTAGRR